MERGGKKRSDTTAILKMLRIYYSAMSHGYTYHQYRYTYKYTYTYTYTYVYSERSSYTMQVNIDINL